MFQSFVRNPTVRVKYGLIHSCRESLEELTSNRRGQTMDDMPFRAFQSLILPRITRMKQDPPNISSNRRHYPRVHVHTAESLKHFVKSTGASGDEGHRWCSINRLCTSRTYPHNFFRSLRALPRIDKRRATNVIAGVPLWNKNIY